MVLAQALRVPPGRFVGDLEHAPAGLAHGVDDGAYFVPRCGSAGDGAVVGREVVHRARGGKADAACLHCFLGEATHGGQLLGGGRLGESAFAHHIGAQRGVADVAGVVDAFGQGVDGVQELREGLPAPIDAGQHGFAGDVFGAFEIAKHEVRVLLAARGDGETAVAHHYARHAVVAGTGAELIPEDLRIHVRVAIDEAWRHNVPLGIHRALGTIAQAPDGGDFAIPHAYVRLETRAPGTVHHRAVLDDQIEAHAFPSNESDTCSVSR